MKKRIKVTTVNFVDFSKGENGATSYEMKRKQFVGRVTKKELEEYVAKEFQQPENVVYKIDKVEEHVYKISEAKLVEIGERVE